jgi:hypothetical protein
MTETTHPTIFVDLTTTTVAYFPTCNGTKADLQKFGVVLKEGLVLRVSDGDLAATGSVIDRRINNAIMVAIPPREHSSAATQGFC